MQYVAILSEGSVLSVFSVREVEASPRSRWVLGSQWIASSRQVILW